MSKSNLSQTEQLEKMRYTNNSLSHKLGYCGIVCSVIAAFIALNSLGPSNILTVLKVLMNILILLVGFLATEKVKVYKKEYSYVMYTIGGVCIARLFWVPLQLFIYWNKYVSYFNDLKADGKDPNSALSIAQTEYKDKLGATVLGVLKDGEISTTGYLTANGNVRAIILIVFLGLAAFCFIASGFVNYTRSTKLNAYLKTVEKK